MKHTYILFSSITLLWVSLVSCSSTPSFIHPKVPMGQLEDIRSIANPLPRTYTVIADGKTLYEGKGICARCHGLYGDGKGTAAKNFHMLPRNFKNHHFWTKRKEGELFWIVKNGSPGTGMLEFQSLLTDQEIWKILRYTETFPSRSYPSDHITPTPQPELINPLQGAY